MSSQSSQSNSPPDDAGALAKAARHVANLSGDNLNKKRENDRENQRISRARKRERVKVLEHENAELRAKIEVLELTIRSNGHFKSDTSSPVTSRLPLTPPASLPDHSATLQQAQIYSCLPLWVAPMCRLDVILEWVVKGNLQVTSYDALFSEMWRLDFPSVPSLLNPEFAKESPLSAFMGKHAQIMAIASIPARTAAVHLMCLVVRWHMSPTQKNYMAMPEYCRPLPIQHIKPHPRWMDFVIWPAARDRLIKHMDWDTEFGEFTEPHNATLDVNWPGNVADMLTTNEKGVVVLNPSFVHHINQVESWSVGQELIDRMPLLAGYVPVHKKQ